MNQFSASFPPHFCIVSPPLLHRFPPILGHFCIVSPPFSKRYKRLKSLYKQGKRRVYPGLFPCHNKKEYFSFNCDIQSSIPPQGRQGAGTPGGTIPSVATIAVGEGTPVNWNNSNKRV